MTLLQDVHKQSDLRYLLGHDLRMSSCSGGLAGIGSCKDFAPCFDCIGVLIVL